MIGAYLDNLDRPKGIVNGLKGEFALAAIKLSNKSKNNNLAHSFLKKAEKIICQQGIGHLFHTAITSGNQEAIDAIWQLHIKNVDINENFDGDTNKRVMPRVMDTYETSHALTLAFEYGHEELVETLLNNQDNWLYLLPNPSALDKMTTTEFYHEYVGLPVLFGLQNYQAKNNIDISSPNYEPNSLEILGKIALDKYFGIGTHFMSHIQTYATEATANEPKQNLKVLQGGRASNLKTHMEDCVRKDTKPKPTHLRIVK